MDQTGRITALYLSFLKVCPDYILQLLLIIYP